MLGLAYLVFSTSLALAQTDIRGELENDPILDRSIGYFVERVFNFALILGALGAFAYLVWGGFDWITSGGEQQKQQGARDKITAAVVGLGVLATVWVIWMLVLRFLGLEAIIVET
jgi:hypothetical protein